MDMDYLKIWLANGSTAVFISVQGIDVFFKLVLVIVSVGFTITKWWQLIKKDPDTFPNPFDDNDEKDANNKKL